MIFESVYPSDEMMGEDNLTMRHAAAQGVHDAVSTIVQYLFVGGVVIMATAIIFKPEKVRKLAQKFTL